jgi:hypothetical protein
VESTLLLPGSKTLYDPSASVSPSVEWEDWGVQEGPGAGGWLCPRPVDAPRAATPPPPHRPRPSRGVAMATRVHRPGGRAGAGDSAERGQAASPGIEPSRRLRSQRGVGAPEDRA